MSKYLKSTKMLDYDNALIQNLIKEKKWMDETDFNKIGKIYNFIRDDIKFGYNIDDSIPASRVLKDGYGQCNTKGVLFMALLRAVGISCRIHGFTIDKKLQKGAITGILYKLAPKSIIHSWVEVSYNGKWYNLEGFILDKEYLSKLQEKFSNTEGSFCGFGAATDNFLNPQIDWKGNDTYIQKEGINYDYGIFADPDDFFGEYQQKLSPVKKWVYKNFARKVMNKNVHKIRISPK